ncbi:MAG: hypothetical protein NC307_00855 [Roseburia sp.]|nr:hypothetical protein [Roseburia sp.]
MSNLEYGYARVSTREQNERRSGNLSTDARRRFRQSSQTMILQWTRFL